jgi:archaellum component FlaC
MESDKEFGLRLFDIVKDSLTKTESKIETLSNIISDLVKSSSSFPSNKNIDDKLSSIKDELDCMDKNTLTPSKNIEDCKSDIDEIKKCVYEMSKSLRNVLYAICISFALMVMAYTFVSSTINTVIEKQISIVKEESILDRDINKKLRYLFKDMQIEDNDDETKKSSDK